MENQQAMSKFSSNLFRILFVLVCLKANAQTSTLSKDSIPIKKEWTPHYTHLQYAGGMGFISVGTGYYFNKRKMGFGPQIGYLPSMIGEVEIFTGAVKYFWTPFEISKKRWRFYPLSTGINVILTLNKDVEILWKDYYPDGYYPWIPAMNWAIFFGGNVSLKADERYTHKRNLTAFYEVALTSRLVELWFLNTQTIKFSQIWNLSFGLRYNFR